jgi:hypothetical protein
MLQLANSVIFLDDVQFDKGGWRNRNRVRNSKGPLWLTVPIIQHGLMDKVIKDVNIVEDRIWRKKHVQTLKLNYPNANAELLLTLNNIIENSSNSLIDLNLKLINLISKYLNIELKYSLSSSYSVSRDQNLRLIALCKNLEANLYLSGPSAKSYLNLELFKHENIKVNWFEFDAKREYPQRGANFLPYLSILDLILNNSQLEAEFYVKSQNNVSS